MRVKNIFSLLIYILHLLFANEERGGEEEEEEKNERTNDNRNVIVTFNDHTESRTLMCLFFFAVYVFAIRSRFGWKERERKMNNASQIR